MKKKQKAQINFVMLEKHKKVLKKMAIKKDLTLSAFVRDEMLRLIQEATK